MVSSVLQRELGRYIMVDRIPAYVDLGESRRKQDCILNFSSSLIDVVSLIFTKSVMISSKNSNQSI